MLANFHEFKISLLQQGSFFCFDGPMSQELMVGIGDALRSKMQLEKVDNSTITKVFAMYIEQTQNIIHYSAEKIPANKRQTEFSNGIVKVGYNNKQHYVICGNLINNESADFICKQLTKLQKMNKDELKSYYKEQRRKNKNNYASKGAGLGFIELARKSVNPIEFEVKKVDDNFSFFSLKTVV